MNVNFERIGPVQMNNTNDKMGLFTNQLKEAGKELHEGVENTWLIQSIFDGSISEEAYQDYLQNLYEIYSQLEASVRLHSYSDDESIREIFQPLVIEELFRAGPIQNDLMKFGETCLETVKAAKDYKKRLVDLSITKPHCLVAHYYLRFLGDLFGGQILAGRLSDCFEGKLDFYDFTELCQAKNLAEPTQFAREFRDLLNNLPLNKQQQEDIFVEVSEGYRLHLRLFNELADRHNV